MQLESKVNPAWAEELWGKKEWNPEEEKGREGGTYAYLYLIWCKIVNTFLAPDFEHKEHEVNKNWNKSN